MKSTRIFIFILVFLGLILLAGWFGLRSFIHSDAFRGWLAKKVNQALRVEGQFEPLDWEGSTFKSAGFTATGGSKSKLQTLRISNISAHFNWWELLKGKWVIDHASAEKIEVLVGKKSSPPPAVTAPSDLPPKPQSYNLPNYLPSEFRIEQLYVASADLHWETNRGDTGQLVGTKLSATLKGPEEWDLTAIGGNAQHSPYPPMQIDQIHASVTSGAVLIHEAKGLLPGGGEVQVVGKVSRGRQLNAQFTCDFSELDANQVLPVDWHVGGKASGHLVYAGDLDRFEHGEVTGAVKIAGAAFDMTNLFVTLHQLAKFGGLNEVRIDSIEANLKYSEHQLDLSNIRASYQDQVRVEGAGLIAPDRLEGNLLIGLSPRILGWIPGAEEKVFSEERDGLHWAKVNISGTPEQPKEDLTKRLISAFRDRMTREFKGQAKDAVKSLLDLFHQ